MAALKLKAGGSALRNLSLVGKLAIGIVFVLLIGAGYFIIFYGDVESQIGAEKQRVTGLETELAQAKDAREAFNRDLAELKRREGLLNKQKTILPDEAETPAFLSTLQTVATISGVELTSWTPQDESFAEFYAKIPMQLTVRGKFHQVARFFYGVGQADRIINMENISIQRSGVKAAGPKGAKPGDNRGAELGDSSMVDVQCLATAFRALTADEAGAKRKGGKDKGKAAKSGGAK
jgi:type IV pilus assembly protein PilO